MSAMRIRKALEELGVERVRRAMAAFADQRNAPGTWPSYCHCFVGHAYAVDGAPEKEVYDTAHDAAANIARMLGMGIGTINALSDAFENSVGEYLAEPTRADLQAECIQFLAEHGSSPERSCVTREEVSV
jgi:transcriptional regulator of met regulon